LKLRALKPEAQAKEIGVIPSLALQASRIRASLRKNTLCVRQQLSLERRVNNARCVSWEDPRAGAFIFIGIATGHNEHYKHNAEDKDEHT